MAHAGVDDAEASDTSYGGCIHGVADSGADSVVAARVILDHWHEPFSQAHVRLRGFFLCTVQ